MATIDFSVVVPTYNRQRALRRLLHALANQQYPRERYEVVVVDDGGKEPLTNLVEEYRDHLQLKIVRHGHGGCGPARQAGVDRAIGSYLVFTDDDCCPAPDWLARLAEAFEEYPDCAHGGNTVNGLEGNVFAEATQFIVALLTTYGCDGAGRIHYCPTSNSAFPAAAFLSVGGLDRSWLNSGGEDRDLCARWLNAGFALRYKPAAMVRHFHSLTPGQFVRQHVRYGRGAWRFHRGSGTGKFEIPGFYWKLVTAPFQKYPAGKGAQVAGAVMLAQLATAAGFLLEAARGKVRRV
jgi:GT2 family glycosyltransferase